MAVNHISPEKVVGSFFNRASRTADISGNVPSDHLVKEDGRMGRRTADKVRVMDDTQFAGRAYEISTADGSCIKSDISFGVLNGNQGTLSIWFKLNSINNGTFFHGVYDTIRLFNSGTKIRVEGNTNSGGTPALFDIPEVQVGVWYHLVVLLDGINDQARVWLNGSESVSGTQTILPELTSLLRIGVYQGIPSVNIDGRIAHVGKWGRELSQQEIEGLYKFEIPHTSIDFYLPLEQSGDEENVHSLYQGAHTFATENFNPGDWVEDADFPYSHLNEKGYNAAGPSYFKNAYVADDHTQRTPAWASFMADADFSIAFKLNISTRQDGNVYDIMSNSGGISSGVYLLITGGKIQITVTKSISNTRTVISRDLRDGLDHDVLVVYEASSLQCRIYVDGLEEPYGAQVTGVGVNQYNPNTSWVIGKYSASAGDRNFTGYIKAVSFYNSALTPATLKTENPVAQPQVASDGTVTDLVGGSTWTSNNLDNTYQVPADSTGLYDTLGHRLLDYPGRLAPRLQLVNAPCVVLNGTDQSISLPYETQVAGDQDTTFWFKVKIDPGSGDYTVFGSGDLSLFRWSTSDTTIRLRGHTNGTESIMTFPHSIRTGEWQDVVLITRVSDSYFTCYINGVQNTEGYISVSSGSSFRINSLGEGSTRWTDGEISLFGKWFRSFSLAEIQALSKQLPSVNGVEDLYVFSEGSASTVYDISGNNKHATIVNAILPDVWGAQDVFHYNFYKGFIKSLKNMNGVEAFFDFTDISAYTFDSSGQITNIRDAAGNYLLTNTHADARFENGALTLGGNYLWMENGHFLSGLNSFDVFIRAEFASSHGSGTDFLVASNDTNVEHWRIGKHPIIGDTRVYYNAASETPAYETSQGTQLSGIVFDQILNYNIKYDGTNLYTGRNTNVLTDHGPTIKPADNPLLTSINFGIEGSQQYLIVFNRNVTDQERSFVNAFMESGLAPEGAVSGLVDQRGYEVTNQYNGASDIRFPDIPEVPADLRGGTFSQKEVEGLAYAGRVISEKNSLTLFRKKVESIQLKRKGNRLILDDYRSTCPSTALQKIHSDFTGTIITVRNEDNLQDASFGFDAYGRLPEKDIIDHLNGTANGRVTDYYFQDTDHVGLSYTQPTLSEMPFIAKNGTIQKDSRGLPALRFDGAQSLTYESQTAFKSMHDGSRGVQMIGFQVDEGQSDFWLVGNTDFQGQVGFEFFGDVFNLDKAHFIVRTNTSDSAILDLNIPMLMGEYNRMVNYIDPSNPLAIERHSVLVNEQERAANTVTELPNTGNTEDGTTSVGALGVRKMEGYINELVFVGDYKADMLKLSRSLMYMP